MIDFSLNRDGIPHRIDPLKNLSDVLGLLHRLGIKSAPNYKDDRDTLKFNIWIWDGFINRNWPGYCTRPEDIPPYEKPSRKKD